MVEWVCKILLSTFMKPFVPAKASIPNGQQGEQLTARATNGNRYTLNLPVNTITCRVHTVSLRCM